jgi:hypothetical protein
MNRSKMLLLVAAMFLIQASSPSAQARAEPCREIAIGSASQPVLLRNSSERPVTLSLHFEAPQMPSLSCGLLAVPADGDSGAQTLASLCPGIAPAASGLLKACQATIVVHGHRGAPTGDLLADLQSNNLAATGR